MDTKKNSPPSFEVKKNLERDKSDPYSYSGTWTLANKYDIKDKDELDMLEATLTTVRAREGIPEGNHDYDHLKSIHKHLFGDLYDWAGKEREMQIGKQSNDRSFTHTDDIEKNLNATFEKLKEDNFLKELPKDEFAKKLGDLVNDINESHPFREGNGRSMREFVTSVSNEAGYEVDWSAMDKKVWNQASKEGFEGNREPMRELMKETVVTLEQANDPANGINNSGRQTYTAAQLRTLYPDMTQLANRLEAQEAVSNASDAQKAAMFAFQKVNSNQLSRDQVLEKHPALEKHFGYWDKSLTMANERFESDSVQQTTFLVRMRDNISKNIVQDELFNKQAEQSGGDIQR